MTDLVAKLKLQFDKGEIERTMGKPSGKGLGSNGLSGTMTAGFGKMLVPLTTIAGATAMLVSSSKMLQGSLGNVIKSISQIVRPFGDLLAAALMPVVSILRPIGVFFNILMRPYIQKAMAAMRAGEALLYAGDTSGALGAFTLGAEYLLKPFLDMSMRTTVEMQAWFMDVLAQLPIVGAAFTGLGDKMREGANFMIETTTNILDVQLGDLLARTEDTTGKHMSAIVKSLSDAEITTAYNSNLIKSNITSCFSSVNTWVGSTWGPSFSSEVSKWMNNAIPKSVGSYNADTGVLWTAQGGVSTQYATGRAPELTAAQKYAQTFAMPGSEAWIKAGLQHGGIVHETGLYQLHEGETVTTPGASYNQPVSVSLNPTYNISTNKSPDEIRRIAQEIADSKYRELVSRMGG